MNKEKKYYKDLDFIRLLSCIAVFLYHLDILKGGYLAVCTFFVLTGYLSCMSSFKKEKFSIFKYYKDRLLHIYLPLLLVVFISIILVTTFTEYNWINLKPETTSIILGYNNYWQLNANLDYFTRFITSPFMHFWYMGILLQFELVFPIIFIILKKLGDKIHRIVPCLLLSSYSIIFAIIFYLESTTKDLMSVYYSTSTRVFSILFGLSIGFIYHYYHNYFPKKINKKVINRLLFYIYTVALIFLFFTIKSTSKYFPIAMLLTSFITCRLIKYGTLINNDKENVINKMIKSLASVSYEVYLVQYPTIFMFQNITIINKLLKTFLIVLITFIISYILHFSLNYKKDKNNKIKFKILRILTLILLIGLSSFGVYKYIKSKDYTGDAEALKNKLAENEKLMLEKQSEFEKRNKEENDEWEKVLNDLDAEEENIKKVVSNLYVVGIGDSVILDAIPYLYKYFPNGYFDAKQSRTDYEADDILRDLIKKNMLGNPIVFGLGTNGQCGVPCQKEILDLCGNRKIFWINVTNDWEVHVNSTIEKLAKDNKNVYLIDWNNISKGHDDYFIYDKQHLKTKGQKAYAEAIYNSIYNVYLDEYKVKKNEILKKHEEEEKKKLSFYGNELLLNVFEYIKDDYKDYKFKIDTNFTYQKLINLIKEEQENNNLTYRLVFVLNDKIKMNNKEYQELIELLNNHEITFIINTKDNINSSNENIKIINIYDEINNDKYMMFDKEHLSNDGNIYLSKIIKKEVQIIEK